MNTTRGGSQQGQVKLNVIPKGQPGDGYYQGINRGIRTGNTIKNEEISNIFRPSSINSQDLHQSPEVSQTNSEGIKQNTKKEMTTTQNKKDDSTKDAVGNDGVGFDVLPRDAVDESNAIKDWQSTLNEEEIAKAFDSGAADDYEEVDEYNNSDVVPVNPRNEGNLQSSVENLGKSRELNVMGSNDRGAKLPDDAKLSDRNTDEQTPKHGFTESLEDESVMLGQDEKSTLPEERLKEVARLEKERNKLRSRLDKEKIIFDKLLVDKQELDEKTKFLGIGSEAADSLVKEIRNKEKEINSIEEKIKDIKQQVVEINQTPEQAETSIQTETQTPQESIVQESEDVIGPESDLIDKGNGEDGSVGEGVDETAEGNSIETLENGKKVGEIGDGKTLLGTIQGLIGELNKDGDGEEAESMSFVAFENFRTKYLDESVNKGMTKEEALSSWKDLLASLRPGDKVVVGLSEQGIELDIPVMSGSEVSMDKVMSNNTVADDYNYAKAA